MAFAGEAYRGFAGGKYRWVFVLEDEQDGRNLIAYCTTKGPERERQSKWTLLREIKPREAPLLGLTAVSFVYAETVCEVAVGQLKERLPIPPYYVWLTIAHRWFLTIRRSNDGWSDLPWEQRSEAS